MRRPVALRRVRRVPANDSGFTVLEVVVAITLVTIVMTALAAFFVNSGKATDLQSQKQTAVEVAAGAMDTARALSGAGMVAGRDQGTSDKLWQYGKDASKFPGVGVYLTDIGEAYDGSNLPLNAGYNAALPTDGDTVTLDNVTFTKNWFLGYCLRDASGNCSPGTSMSAPSTYLRIVVAITWSNSGCVNGLCSYVTTAMVNANSDPIFDTSKTAPKLQLNSPGDQQSEVGQSVFLPITLSSAGTDPLTWTPPTLPAGLQWAVSAGQCAGSPACIYGTPTAKTSTPAPVQLNVSDALQQNDAVSFHWTVIAGPTIADLVDQSTAAGSAATALTPTATGGSTPYTWSATGLPPGITISSTTGKMSGTPTRADVYPVTVKVVDRLGGSDTETFSWNVWINVVFGPASCTGPSNGLYHCTASYTATGVGPYTWSSTDPAVVFTVAPNTLSATVSIYRTRGTYVSHMQVAMTDGPKATTWDATQKAGTA